MKKLILIAIVIAAAYFGGIESGLIPAQHRSSANISRGADDVLAAAFDSHRNNIQVQGSGEVTRVLADDDDGSRHQRFIVTLTSGQTLLVAHNIDVAERIASLKTGDFVEFNGEYEWNPQGGVIHWTHHDPQGEHLSGWVKHNGHTYQ